MEGTRGQEKYHGEFRRTQNWIGSASSTLKDASFIPPTTEDMQDAMSDLEEFVNNNALLDSLINAALVHYQFETIHPFLDGNGRLGRLLVTLYLIDKKVISYPSLYISYYLKKNRIEYYDRMSEVRAKGNFEQWIEFFLRAIFESALDASYAAEKLAHLHDINIAKIKSIGRSSINALEIFGYLEANPIIEIGRTAEMMNLSYNTVANAIGRLVDLGILEQTTSGKRNRVFSYKGYLDILRSGT